MSLSENLNLNPPTVVGSSPQPPGTTWSLAVLGNHLLPWRPRMMAQTTGHCPATTLWEQGLTEMGIVWVN